MLLCLLSIHVALLVLRRDEISTALQKPPPPPSFYNKAPTEERDKVGRNYLMLAPLLCTCTDSRVYSMVCVFMCA
eukprot:1151980-Pelagomonas_calceolata.AAC.2